MVFQLSRLRLVSLKNKQEPWAGSHNKNPRESFTDWSVVFSSPTRGDIGTTESSLTSNSASIKDTPNFTLLQALSSLVITCLLEIERVPIRSLQTSYSRITTCSEPISSHWCKTLTFWTESSLRKKLDCSMRDQSESDLTLTWLTESGSSTQNSTPEKNGKEESD